MFQRKLVQVTSLWDHYCKMFLKGDGFIQATSYSPSGTKTIHPHPSWQTQLSLLILSWIPSSTLPHDTCGTTLIRTHNSELKVTKHLKTTAILILDTEKICRSESYCHPNQHHKWTSYKEDTTTVNLRSTDSQRWSLQRGMKLKWGKPDNII